MNSPEMFALAWRNLMRRKSRTVLTVLSVVIGAVAIILMLSFGYGMQESQRKQFEMFGQMNAIQVSPTVWEDPTKPSNSTVGKITDQAVERIRQMEHVVGVLPSMHVPYPPAFRDENLHLMTSLSAIDFADLADDALTMDEGSVPVSTRQDPFLVGNSVMAYLLDARSGDMDFQGDVDWANAGMKLDAAGMTSSSLTNPSSKYSVKLSYAGKYSSSKLLAPSGIYISLDTYDKLVEMEERWQQSVGISADAPEGLAGAGMPSGPMAGGLGSAGNRTGGSSTSKSRSSRRVYDTAVVTVDDIDFTDQVVQEINNTMRLEARANSDMISNQQTAMQVVQLIFGGIGSISLFIAAIGIANTMLMSIHERTREIGVMKVIGAQVSDIRKMFLIEAILIGILGGILGVLVSYGLSAVVNKIALAMLAERGQFPIDYISYIPPWLPFAAFGFSALIGLLAGYLPANRATRISAIEAIRTD